MNRFLPHLVSRGGQGGVRAAYSLVKFGLAELLPPYPPPRSAEEGKSFLYLISLGLGATAWTSSNSRLSIFSARLVILSADVPS